MYIYIYIYIYMKICMSNKVLTVSIFSKGLLRSPRARAPRQYLCVYGIFVCVIVRVSLSLHHQSNRDHQSIPLLTTWHFKTPQDTETLQRHCKSLQNTAKHCKTLQNTRRHCYTATMQDTWKHCQTLQDTARHPKKTLQPTARHRNINFMLLGGIDAQKDETCRSFTQKSHWFLCSFVENDICREGILRVFATLYPTCDYLFICLSFHRHAYSSAFPSIAQPLPPSKHAHARHI